MFRVWRKCLSRVAGTVVLIVLIGCAGQKSGPEELSYESGEPDSAAEAQIPERVDSVLKGMSDYISKVPAVTVELHVIRDEVEDPGYRIHFTEDAKLKWRRPNRLQASIKGDLHTGRLYYDGTKLTLYNVKENVYSVIEAPPTIDEMVDYLVANYGVGIPLPELTLEDPYQALIENVRNAFYVGRHSVRGIACHHLFFEQDNIDWQIWIEDSKRPLPRKVLITYKNEPMMPQYGALLTGFNAAPGIKDSDFVFTQPKGAEQVESIRINE